MGLSVPCQEINNNMDMDIEDVNINITTETPNAVDVKNKLDIVLGRLRDKISARIEHDPTGYSKTINCLDNTVTKLPTSRDSALQKSLFSFGKSITQVYICFVTN